MRSVGLYLIYFFLSAEAIARSFFWVLFLGANYGPGARAGRFY
jgi:hypothetical protein